MLDHRLRFALAVGLSLLLHGLLIAFSPRPPSALAPGPVAHAPLNVVIAPPAPEPVPESAPEPAPAAAAPAPQPLPRPRPRPRAPETPPPVSKAPTPLPVEPPVPLPQMPPIPAPPVDMLAAIEARRAQRRAQDSAARGPPVVAQPPPDAATRNLQTLSGREGVGGVFQILRVGPRTAEYAFNGWKPDARSQWRQVIEVDAGLGGNVELAIVRSMIDLIRTHYSGDFNWESRRLQRVVKLSARTEDQLGLEDFMLKEFFGQPVLNPRGIAPAPSRPAS